MSLPAKLLEYYSKELYFLKQYGNLFNKKFPTIAKRLGFIDGKSEDPHVERLIESVALLTAQLQQRMDDDLSELTQGILETLMPQFLRPIPAVSVVQFASNPEASTLQQTLSVARHTQLYSRTSEGVECRFRTCYPLSILPVELTSAALVSENYENDWSLSLSMLSRARTLPAGATVRIYLDGQVRFNYLLYAALLSQVATLEYRKNDQKVSYHQQDIKAAGFDEEDGLCADDLHIDPVHNIIRDYAVFPERFLFIDLPLPTELFIDNDLTPIIATIKFRSGLTVRKLSVLSQQCNTDNIKLNCVPVVNIFQQMAEPIIPDNNTHEYLLTPDVRTPENYAIYAIKEVRLKRKNSLKKESDIISPLFGVQTETTENSNGIVWQSQHKLALMEKGEVTNVFLSFATLGEAELNSQTDMVTVMTTCTNKNIIADIPTGNSAGDFTTQINLPGIIIKGLMHPRLPIFPQFTDINKWRFISQLSLNKMLYSGKQGVSSLKQALDIYNISQNSVYAHLVNLLTDIKVESIMGRLYADNPLSVARGLAVTLLFHKDALEQPGFYLFCSVVEKYLGQYAPVNSFIQTTTRIDGEEDAVVIWPKRAANLVWL
ncbi:type VI secretion system baseplate subunit TssF [Enterobacteriaceae bacterium LUAb1]